MADLISRAAAIEALRERPHNWTDSEAEIAEVCAWESHKSAIENVPAVDAIPVEWLENRLNTLCFESMWAGAIYGDRIGELAKSINEVMKLWQHEQEART